MENVKIDFGAVMTLLADRLYSTPAVFLRENVQNAIDALRMLPLDGRRSDPSTCVRVSMTSTTVIIEDWGIGMSDDDIRNYFWYIGRSSKRSKEAIACRVIGYFGIGAFANFGTCNKVDLQTKRKGFPVFSSTLHKSDLQKNNTGYNIVTGGTLNHFGTLIIGHLINAVDVAKFRSYLEAHVRYIPERILFNNELISGKDFPVRPSGFKTLHSQRLPFGDVPVDMTVSVNVSQEVLISLTSPDDRVSGLLRVGNGQIAALTNRFMVTPRATPYWSFNLPMNGWLNTSFLKPNVAREGLDTESTALVDTFVNELGSAVLAVLDKHNLVFAVDDVVAYLGHQSYEKTAPLLANYPARLFGKRTSISLSEIAKRSRESRLTVVYSQTDDPPVEVASVATDQNLLVVLLTSVPSGIKTDVVTYLEKHCGAKEIGSFQLNAVPLQLDEVTPTMQSVCSAIDETLSRFWGLSASRVRLCRVPGNSHVAAHDSKDGMVVSVNVDSPIFKELERHCGSTVLLPLINGTLLGPFLGEVLVRLIPRSASAGVGAFRPKPYLIRVEKIRAMDLVAGDGGWDGPSDTCVVIRSKAFPALQGYYVKLPDRIDHVLRQYLSASPPPAYLWYADTLLVLCTIGREQVIKIELRAPALIRVDDKVHGSITGDRRFLSYRTGTFLPIPHPAFSDLLPLDGPKDLTCGFRLFGFDVKHQDVDLE